MKNLQEQEINIMKDFLNGNLSVEQFWNELKKNNKLFNLLINNKKRTESDKSYDYPRYIYEKYDGSFDNKEQLFYTITNYFSTQNLPYEIKNKELKQIILLRQIQPNWVNITNEKYLNNIYQKAPENLNKNQKIKWCKEEISKDYLYDKCPPKWLQNPEWPTKNGKPLKFINQNKDTENVSKEIYYFEDEQKNIIKIEQYD